MLALWGLDGYSRVGKGSALVKLKKKSHLLRVRSLEIPGEPKSNFRLIFFISTTVCIFLLLILLLVLTGLAG